MYHFQSKARKWLTGRDGILLLLVVLTLAIGGYFLILQKNNSLLTTDENRDIAKESIPIETIVPLSTWLWDSPSGLEKEEIEKLLDFCRNENIDTIYLGMDEYIEIYESKKIDKEIRLVKFTENAGNFLAIAHAKGIRVQALAGDVNWGEPRYRYVPELLFDYIARFNSASPEESKFDGIQFDIEPYGQNGYNKNKEARLRNYLQLVDALTNKYIKNKDLAKRNFALGFAVPFWFDDENNNGVALLWKGVKKPVGFHVMDMLGKFNNGYIVIMDYRNFAEGKDGSIEHAQQEFAYAEENSLPIKILIGQETDAVTPAKVTFYGKGKAFFKAECQKIIIAYKDNPLFAGIAIHHIKSYIKLESKYLSAD